MVQENGALERSQRLSLSHILPINKWMSESFSVISKLFCDRTLPQNWILLFLPYYPHLLKSFVEERFLVQCARGSPSRGGDVAVYSVLVSVFFCLYDPFNCISFHKFSRQLSVSSLCSSGLISALLVLSTIFLFTKVSFSPDIIPCGWLSTKKKKLTN